MGVCAEEEEGAVGHELGGEGEVRGVLLEWSGVSITLDEGAASVPRMCGVPLRKAAPEKSGVRRLLSRQCGRVEMGSVLGILGGSGAGKSSLLNVLAGRVVQAVEMNIEGSVTVDGAPRGDTFKQIASYCEQEERFFPELTVRETLLFAARCKMPESVADAVRQARVDSVLSELQLSKVQHSKVGGADVRGISGGEQKRLALGIELLSSNPSILFLDEPTSGLDAFNAESVVRTLRSIADRGRTVICTVHQPRSSVFELFDKVLVLSEGNMVYFGDGGMAAVDYFSSLDFPCPRLYNPADFFVDISSVDSRSADAAKSSSKRLRKLTEAFDRNLRGGLETSIKASAEAHVSTRVKGEEAESRGRRCLIFGEDPRYTTGFWSQLRWTLQRCWVLETRDVLGLVTRLLGACVFSLLIGLIWSNVDGNTPEGVQALNGAIYIVLINSSFGALTTVIFTFPFEKLVVGRERVAKMYRVSTYFIATQLVKLFLDLVTMVLFSCVCYWLIGLRDSAEAFFKFLAILFLGTSTAGAVGLAAGAIMPNARAAAAVAPVVIVISLLFGGYLVSSDQYPDWLEWLSYTSYMRYAYQAAVQNEFLGTTRECSGSSCPIDAGGDGKIQGQEICDFYGACGQPEWLNYVMLVLLQLFFRILAYIFLRINKPKYVTVGGNHTGAGDVPASTRESSHE